MTVTGHRYRRGRYCGTAGSGSDISPVNATGEPAILESADFRTDILVALTTGDESTCWPARLRGPVPHAEENCARSASADFTERDKLSAKCGRVDVWISR